MAVQTISISGPLAPTRRMCQTSPAVNRTVFPMTRERQPTAAFRLNLGYGLTSQIDLRFRYTMFDGTSFDSRTALPGGTLATVRLHPDNDSMAVTDASAATELQMHVFDLELGNWCSLTECVSARPFMGVRSTDFDQSLMTSYTVGGNQRFGLDSISLTGVGFRAGSDVQWQFLPSVRFEGGVAGSILMANCKTSHVESGALTPMNIGDNYLLGVPVGEIYMGLAYDFEPIFVAVGLETSTWLNTGSYSHYLDDVSDGTYSRASNDFMLGAAYFRAGWTW